MLYNFRRFRARKGLEAGFRAAAHLNHVTANCSLVSTAFMRVGKRRSWSLDPQPNDAKFHVNAKMLTECLVALSPMLDYRRRYLL